MTIKQARKILKENNVTWSNYFDLPIFTNDLLLNRAIKRIKLFLLTGI